jgi:hypothetical protein
LGDRFVRTQVSLALEVLGGQRQIGVGCREVGLRLLQVDAKGDPIHLRQRGAGGHAVAHLHHPAVHLAGDLGRHGDGVEGADLTHELHRWTLLAYLGRDELHLARREGPFEGLGGGGEIVVIGAVAAGK